MRASVRSFPGEVLAALVLGAVLAQVGAWALAPRGTSTRGPWLWIADHEGGRVVALDRRLATVRELPLTAPRWVAATVDGGGWAVAGPRDGVGEERLIRIDPDGATRPIPVHGRVVDLASRENGDAVLLIRTGPGETEVRRVPCRGAGHRTLAELPVGACLAVGEDRVLVGLASGELVLLRPEPAALLRWSRVAGSVHDLVAAPGGGWWVLAEGEHGPLLLRVSSALAVKWSRSTGGDPLALAPLPDADQVWVADGSRALLRRIGSQGGLLQEELVDAGGGVPQGLSTWPRGIVLGTTGAVLLRESPSGSWRTQGGFGGIVDLALRP